MMFSQARVTPRVISTFVAVILAIGLVGSQAVGPARAADWQTTGLTERTFALHAPASGAFFATTDRGVRRSDDGGATWRPIALPPGTDPARVTGFAVDPNDHTRVFVNGWRTTDDAATWTELAGWPGQRTNEKQSAQLVVSPADPSVLYLALRNGDMGTDRVRMYRSRDGGDSWEQFLALGMGDFRPGAGVGVVVFTPHPANPGILFHSVVGFTGRFNQGVLRRGADFGATSQEVLFKTLRIPSAVVGGHPAAPSRLYAFLRSEEAEGELYRSEDDGATWSRIESFTADRQAYGGLADDPNNPGRLFANAGGGGGGIKMSEDGGQTWTDLGLTDQVVNALALGIDGGNLYAASDTGVFRLPLR